MLNRYLIFTLINLISSAWADSLPNWITHGQTMDSNYYYVVCSHDGLDPEEVKQIAESKCLASAAKLGGVTVKFNVKTVHILTGADASEVAEIQPLIQNVKCEWTERFLEKVGQGFRVWLQCKIKKSSTSTIKPSKLDDKTESSSINPSSSPLQYKRAILTLTTVPQADRIAIIGESGERIIEVTSNVTKIELHEGDTKIVARKQKYMDSNFDVSSWKHGDSMAQTLYLKQEM